MFDLAKQRIWNAIHMDVTKSSYPSKKVKIKARHLRYNMPLSKSFAWRNIPTQYTVIYVNESVKAPLCTNFPHARYGLPPACNTGLGYTFLSSASSVEIPKMRPLSPTPSCDWLYFLYKLCSLTEQVHQAVVVTVLWIATNCGSARDS